jgi:hypothetical protein
MRRINSLLGAAFHSWAALGGFARIFLCILIVIAGTVISAEVFSMRLNPHAFWLETDRKAPVDYGYGPDKGIGPPRPNHVLGQTPAIPKSLIAAPTVAGAARAPEGRRLGRLFFPPSRSRLSPRRTFLRDQLADHTDSHGALARRTSHELRHRQIRFSRSATLL